MYCVKSFLSKCVMFTAVLFLSACGDVTDDLNPSADDKRPVVEAGSTGYLPGQLAADFSLSTSTADTFQLSDHLAAGTEPADAVVLYFTMWCPICLAHSDHMYNVVIPQFRNRGTVVYALVDYVSGSVAGSRASEIANGYAGSEFVTLVDDQRTLMEQFNAAMGSVIVIDADGVILMNEDYRNGEDLMGTLDRLLP